jgi:hypothetical protein
MVERVLAAPRLFPLLASLDRLLEIVETSDESAGANSGEPGRAFRR